MTRFKDRKPEEQTQSVVSSPVKRTGPSNEDLSCDIKTLTQRSQVSIPQITTDIEEINLVEVNTPTMNNNEDFATSSHIDEMRQEMMNLMDDNVRDSVVPV